MPNQGISQEVADPLRLPGHPAGSEHPGLEGESPITEDNHLLEKFELEGIPPAPRGQPQIEVAVNLIADAHQDLPHACLAVQDLVSTHDLKVCSARAVPVPS